VTIYKGFFVVLAFFFTLFLSAPESYAFPEYTDCAAVIDCTGCHAWTFCDVCPADPTCAAPTTWTITSSAGAGGSISPLGAVPVTEGNNQTFTITPNTGFAINDVLVDSSSVGAVPSYTFNNVTADHTIAASFVALPSYTINASVNGLGGSISPSGVVSVFEGDDQTFTITPDLGYDILDVVIDSGSVGAVTSYTFFNVMADDSITASFELSAFPFASFTADPLSGVAGAPVAVQFTDTSTGNPTSWLWDFGDGQSSTDQHPLHSYYEAATYPVSLTVANGAGEDTITDDYIVNACSVQFSVKLEGDGLFNTIMGAYADAVWFGLDTIMIKGQIMPEEDIYFDEDAPIHLKGGYDCDFLSNNFGFSVIPGTITIASTSGTVTLSDLMLKTLPERFVDNGDGTITDITTGLVWLKDADCFGQMTWANALTAAAGLADGACGLTDGSLAGDWWLPEDDPVGGVLRDWQDLMDTTYSSPPLSDTYGTGQWSEGDAFSGVQSAPYWSSTEFDVDSSWTGNFTGNGSIDPSLKTDSHYVWPVRNAF